MSFAAWGLLVAATLAPPSPSPAPIAAPIVEATQPTPTDPPIAFAADRDRRMTVKVMVNDQGPYDFVLDTGAERTVISTELAHALKLPAAREVRISDIAGTTTAHSVTIDRLGVGGKTVRGIEAPTLARSGLGAAGLLGIDGFANQRIIMDFKTDQISIRPAPTTRERADPDTIVVQAKRRFGQLILADASAAGRRIYVIIDSGAENSIGNTALQRLLAKRAKDTPFAQSTLVSVTGRSAPATMAQIRAMTIGRLTISDLTVAFADVHPFRQFGITKQPAMLLGMDMLRTFDRVSLDFGAKKVRFLLRHED